MPKLNRPASLNAAECARRTGLTVRALRVYERQGLIEPARSGKGWRLYGPSELQRPNIIVTLKTFGMTLAQIRSLLKTSPPPLERVLEMQLRAGRARRDEAEKALELVRAALATIKSGRPLALEELCNLTRRSTVRRCMYCFALFRLFWRRSANLLLPRLSRSSRSGTHLRRATGCASSWRH